MFFVRVQTMGKNRIYTILDRHPEILSLAPDVSDLFGASGMKWLRQAVLPGQDNRLLSSELELLEILKRKIFESNGRVKELAKAELKKACETRDWDRIARVIDVMDSLHALSHSH